MTSLRFYTHYGHALALLASSMGVIIATASSVRGQEAASDRIPGRFVCLNNPAPECRTPPRPTTGPWVCRNSPNPSCQNPPRAIAPLEPGMWSCRMNQNVVCENPVRYSVEGKDRWPSRF